jgi:hypothetical protein
VAVEPTRRAVLAASAATLPLLATGCLGVQVLGAPPPAGPDISRLRSAIFAEELMVARYAAAISQPSGASAADQTVAGALAIVHAEHAAHLAQLRSRLIQPAASTPSASPAQPAPLPAGRAATLQALEQYEQAASDRLIGQLAGLPPSLAQLFASIAASEATHVPFLQAAGQGR